MANDGVRQFCPHCNAAVIEPKAKYCEKCGRLLYAAVHPASPQDPPPTKIRFVVYILVGFFVLYLLTAATGAPESSQTRRPEKNKPLTSAPPPKAPEKILLPKVEFAGQVSPRVAARGDKVIIRIDVKNLDSSRTIEGLRILFSSSDFLDEGLAIVNVMSGGIQDGRAFVWQNEGTKIPPREQRSFQIVGKANRPGKYESIIQIKDQRTAQVYEDPQGNSELVAKLTVMH